MQKNCLVSIIIPIFNSQKYLKQCLDSITNQSYKNLEIICVDDGSTDKSCQIIKKYQEKDSRLILIKKSNGGVSSARNRGLDCATGECMLFVDADDWLNEDAVEILLKNMLQTSADIVQSGYTEYIDEKLFYIPLNERIIDKRVEDLKIEILKAKNMHNKDYGALRCVWGKLIKSKVIKKIRFNESLYLLEDGIFLIDILNNVKKVQFINHNAYYYRIMLQSASHRFDEKIIEQYKLIIDETMKLSKQNPVLLPYHYVVGYDCLCSYISKCCRYQKFTKPQKIQKIKKIIQEKEFLNIIKNLNVSLLSFKERIAFYLIKSKKVILLYYLCILKDKLKLN